MGAYVNPEGMTKEDWLAQHGEKALDPSWIKRPAGMLPVCLVFNARFTAAAIAFSEREFEEFIRFDGRGKLWYYCKIEDLKTVSPELESYLKGV